MRRWLQVIMGLVLAIGFVASVSLLEAPATETGVVDALGEPVQPTPLGQRDAAIGVGILLLGSWLAGRLVLSLGLPRITGYLVFGALVGPSAMVIVREDQLDQLGLVNDMAISLIALIAGGEIRIKTMKDTALAVVLAASFQTLLAVLVVGTVVYFGMNLFGLEEALSTPQRIGISALLGVVSAANSPATVIAIIAETHSRGPVSRLALSTAVSIDLLIVAVFGATMAFVATAFGLENAGDDSGVVQSIVIELAGSAVAGVAVGLLMTLVVRAIHANLAVFVLLTCLAIPLISEPFHFDPLIIALVAGLVMENIFPKATGALFETLEELSMPVYCVFFSLAGASIDFSIIAAIWPAAIALVLARAVALTGGTVAAVTMTSQGTETKQWLWTGFISQAGLSLALAAIIEQALGETEVGQLVYSLILASVAINQLAGPILFKIGLDKSGEMGEGRTLD